MGITVLNVNWAYVMNWDTESRLIWIKAVEWYNAR